MSPTPTTPLDTSTRLAVDRTRLAYERTLMAWVRTATSLISFGFTIYKFFQQVGSASQSTAFGPPARNFGLLLVILGIVLLLAGLINRHRVVRSIEQRRQTLYDEGLSMMPTTHRTSPNMAVSLLLLLGGLLVVLGIVARTGPFS